MRETTALVTIDLLGLRRIGKKVPASTIRKASGLPNDANRKSMKSKLRSRDFATGIRENVEIVADVFNTSRAIKKDLR